MPPPFDPDEFRPSDDLESVGGFPDGVTSRPLHPERATAREARRHRTEREGTRQLSRRGLAALLDVAFALGAVLLAGAIAGPVFGLPAEQRPLVALAAAMLLDAGLPMRPGRRRGQTAGKQLVGLRTRRVDGEPLSAGRMLQLTLLRWMSQALRQWAYSSYDRRTDTEVVDARNPPPVRPLRGAAIAPFDDAAATRTTSSRAAR